MGGRLGGWGVETSEDEEGEHEDFMNGVSEMVRPSPRVDVADGSFGPLGTWSCSCSLAEDIYIRYLLPKALLLVSLHL